MDGVCAAVAGGGSSSHGGDPVSALNAAAAISGNHHRAWYDASTAAALQQQASAAAGDDINAYFKAGSGAANAAVASSYFSQMQDAYSGMSSYHGRFFMVSYEIGMRECSKFTAYYDPQDAHTFHFI